MDNIKNQIKQILDEFFTKVAIKKGEILVIGMSTSEVLGKNIGTSGSLDVANTIFNEIYNICLQKEIFLAVQCCEHLNRAIVTSEDCAIKYNLCQVNAVPHEKAGGSFAKAAYFGIKNAVLVENIQAHAGIDIGATLIGMHLKQVAVPVRIDTKFLGKAPVFYAKTRPKFIGGVRTIYDENLT